MKKKNKKKNFKFNHCKLREPVTGRKKQKKWTNLTTDFKYLHPDSRTRGGGGLILIRLEVAAAVNSKKPLGITTVFAFMTSKTSPEPKTSEKRLESPKPWNATNHAKRKQRKTRQMKSCKAVLWLFPIITNTGLLFFPFFFSEASQES